MQALHGHRAREGKRGTYINRKLLVFKLIISFINWTLEIIYLYIVYNILFIYYIFFAQVKLISRINTCDKCLS